MTAPLPPEERHDDPRQVLINAHLSYPINDESSIFRGNIEAAEVALAALAAAGYRVVRDARVEHRVYPTRILGRPVEQPSAFDARAFAQNNYGIAEERIVGPWRPVGEDDTNAH